MLYNTVRAILRFIYIILGFKVEGLEHLPADGAVIVAANHVSNWDPIMIALAINRPVHFMGKAELFNHKILGRLLTAFNAFQVKRGSADRQAIKHALKILEEGKVLGIFPEGTRNKTGHEIKARTGIAFIALRSRTAILPVACIGTDRIFPLGWFRPLTVRVGELISLEEYQDSKINSAALEQLSDEVFDKINVLLNKSSRN